MGKRKSPSSRRISNAWVKTHPPMTETLEMMKKRPASNPQRGYIRHFLGKWPKKDMNMADAHMLIRKLLEIKEQMEKDAKDASEK